jgi:hypothetical protein
MPVCVEYYSDDKYEYSTALMFAYINLKKPEKIKLETSKLLFNLDLNCWDKNTKPSDVISCIKSKKYKYKDHVKRITESDLRYPIIVDSNLFIIDGVHRYVKSVLTNKKIIDIYIFDKKLMKKFIVGKRGEKINLQLNDYIELYEKRFNML